jgi:Flp pilus assembly protein TadG
MTHRNTRGTRGNAILEMSLVCIPLLCSFLAIFELSRAVWTYHTLAQALKGGARYAVVHGARCADASSACTASVGDIALVIGQTGVGLDPSALRLTLAAGGQSVLCASMSACTGNSTAYPAAPYNAVGQAITITGVYSFRSVLASLWPDQGSASFSLAAKSTEVIQF